MMFTKCDFCSESIFEVIFEVEVNKNNKFRLLKCGKCGVVVTNPKLTGKDLAKWYQGYRSEDGGVRFGKIINAVMKEIQINRAKKMGLLAGERLIVDVGCGQATELKWLNEHRHKVLGIEYSKDFANNLSKKSGLKIISGKPELIRIEAGSAGVVTFNHSLEHLEQARTWLDKTKEWLGRGGYVIISVPNFSSIEARLFGKSWFHLDIPRHLYHFSEKWLVNHLKNSGFEMIESNHKAWEYDLFSCWQSILNFWYPKEKYFFYNYLRVGFKKNWSRMIIVLPVIFLSGWLALGLVLIELVIGGGGTVSLVFKKR